MEEDDILEQKKLLILVAVVVIVIVAAVAVALNNNGEESSGKIRYNYEVYLSGPGIYNPEYQTMNLELVLKNDGYNILGDNSGLQVNFVKATVYAGGVEYEMDRISGILSDGNSTTLNIRETVPASLTMDDIDDVKITYEIPEIYEETYGKVNIPILVHDTSL